jgi:hypothetical protein
MDSRFKVRCCVTVLYLGGARVRLYARLSVIHDDPDGEIDRDRGKVEAEDRREQERSVRLRNAAHHRNTHAFYTVPVLLQAR